MSAKEQMRAMIEQLMGSGADEGRAREINFDDTRVCRPFLLGCCPYSVLSGTRVDMGECSKIHDLALKSDFENASKSHDYGYDVDAFEVLSSFIRETEERAEAAKVKLRETQEELSEDAGKNMGEIHELSEQIGSKLSKAEELAKAFLNVGNIDESMVLMSHVEALKKEKIRKEYEFRSSLPASVFQQQKLRVCEVCSAFLGIHDNDRRLADHFGGKLHLGFIKIRQEFEQLKKAVADRKANGTYDKFVKRPRERKRDEPSRHRQPRRSRSPERSRYRRRYEEHRRRDHRRGSREGDRRSGRSSQGSKRRSRS